jgi:nucleoside-diphosphate-sugar epimerase
MRILVTGAGGFLGRRLVRSLLRQGQDDLRLHYRSQTDPGLEELARQYPHATLQTVSGNLLRPAEMRDLVQDVDLIIHGAAAKRGAAADIYLNTVVGTRNLLDAAVAAGCRRIVLVSSFAVFRSSALPTGAVLDESCPVEPDGVQKGAYGFAKVQQELLFLDYQRRHGFEAVVLRPGVIYGPGDGAFSSRVGLMIGPVFVSLGGRCLLPLTYVDNCADAIVVAAVAAPAGAVFSVVDNDLPSCREYLSLYERHVARLRKVIVPHWLFRWGARAMTAYNRRSRGQLPALFTGDIVNSMYRRFLYSNAALARIGWKQGVSTESGLQQTFASLRQTAGGVPDKR